jgi:hypothetical protein
MWMEFFYTKYLLKIKTDFWILLAGLFSVK